MLELSSCKLSCQSSSISLGEGEKREEKKSLMVTVILSGGTGNSTNSLRPDLRPKANKISSRSLRFRDWFRPVNALEGMRKVNAQVFVLLYVIYIRYHHSQESFASKLMYNSTQGGFKHRGNGSVSDVHTCNTFITVSLSSVCMPQ